MSALFPVPRPKINLRPYQSEAIESFIKFFAENAEGNPIGELATGLGKSILIAELMRHFGEKYPNMRMMMLTDSKELIRQNYEKLRTVWGTAPAGIYSAGLKRRDTQHRIIYAGIQSVCKKAEEFGSRHLVVVDECHRINPKAQTQYQTFFESLGEITRASGGKMRVAGLTATPYRLDSGNLIGRDQIFTDIIYSYDLGNGIEDGWLSPLTTRAPGGNQIDTGKINIKGGDFDLAKMDKEVAEAEYVRAVCANFTSRLHDRKSILIFCPGIKSAQLIAAQLIADGYTASSVTGETPNRDEVIKSFTEGHVQFLTNCDILTTGFDYDGIDGIVLLRATTSTGLLVQMVGRGTRILGEVMGKINASELSEERRQIISLSKKPNCLVLDYGGNLKRHGALNLIRAKEAKVKKDNADESVKECTNPVCWSFSPLEDWKKDNDHCPECGTRQCVHCHEFINYEQWGGQGCEYICPTCGCDQADVAEAEYRNLDVEDTPDDAEIVVSSNTAQLFDLGWREVKAWKCDWHVNHSKQNSIPTLKVTYRFKQGKGCSEWVCIEHPEDNYGRKMAEKWWQLHQRTVIGNCPAGLQEAVNCFEHLTMPRFVRVDETGKFPKITGRKFEEWIM